MRAAKNKSIYFQEKKITLTLHNDIELLTVTGYTIFRDRENINKVHPPLFYINIS